jgi:branched-chain amino acid transport system ATP-binding protein
VEIETVMDLIREIRRKGVTVLVIEHVMKAVMGLCDRILVLHHGKRIALDTPQEIATDDRVIEAYLGEKYAAAKVRNAS